MNAPVCPKHSLPMEVQVSRWLGAVWTCPVLICQEMTLCASSTVSERPQAPLDATESPLEALLAQALDMAGIACPAREYRFCPPRRWRIDFAWPEQRLAVELEGGTYTQGRHTRHAGFEADCEKYNRLTLMGWRLLRYTGPMIRSGQAVKEIAEGLALPALL